MNLKKFISGVSALTIAASAFAGMAVTASATDTQATLVHTAHAAYDAAKANGASADNEKEYYNNDRGSGWVSYAFAEFSFSLPANETITKATLTWRKTESKNYNTTINYLNVGQTVDYNTLTTDKLYNYSGKKTWIENVASGTADAPFNTDVTAAVQDIAKSQSYIIFQFTGHAGSANLYGKASEYAPSLTITTTAETLYEATFTETNGADANVTVYSDSERTTVVAANQLRSGNTYYYTATATGYEDYQGDFTVADQNPAVSFTMTAKPAAGKIKVYYKDTNDNEIADPVEFPGTYVGESTRYTAPKYIVNGSTLYEKNDTTYAYTETAVAADKDADNAMVYNVSDTGTYQFIDVSGNDTWTQYSGGSAAKGIAGNQDRTASTTFTVAESGVYTITASSNEAVRIVNTTSTSNVSWNMPASQIVAYIPKDGSATDVVLTAGTTLYIVANGSSNWVDYVLLKKTADVEEKAFTFDAINMSTLEGIVTVTVDGVTKSGVLPENIKNYSGDLKLAIIITDIPDGAAVTTVIE